MLREVNVPVDVAPGGTELGCTVGNGVVGVGDVTVDGLTVGFTVALVGTPVDRSVGTSVALGVTLEGTKVVLVKVLEAEVEPRVAGTDAVELCCAIELEDATAQTAGTLTTLVSRVTVAPSPNARPANEAPVPKVTD